MELNEKNILEARLEMQKARIQDLEKENEKYLEVIDRLEAENEKLKHPELKNE